MDAYARALYKVSLAGPTLFGQVIDRAAQIAGESLSHHSNKYYVLLIITVKDEDMILLYWICSLSGNCLMRALFFVGWSPYKLSRNKRCFGEGIESSLIGSYSWSWGCWFHRNGGTTFSCFVFSLLLYQLFLGTLWHLNSGNWQILDADNGRRLESSTGRVATRDIVQFVPMRDVHSEWKLIPVCLPI